MNEQVIDESIELEVTDFGPIVEARIDLRPLTVFVGPSNTGKSYLAILIYALHKIFSGDLRFAGRRFRRGFPFLLGQGNQELSEENLDALLEMVNSLGEGAKSKDQYSLVLPSQATEILRTGFNQLADALSDEIGRCFGVGGSYRLIRRGRTNISRIVMRQQMSGRVDPA